MNAFMGLILVCSVAESIPILRRQGRVAPAHATTHTTTHDMVPLSVAACQTMNRVANREDNINAGGRPVVRPWSVTWGESFPLRSLANPSLCQNTSSLLVAVRDGTRTWPVTATFPEDDSVEPRPTSSSLQREVVPSVFHPQGCGVPSFTPQRLCSALADYSDVLLIGDSLMRHVRQALMMVSSGDWEHGAWPVDSTNGAKAQDRSDCRCDGSFSEVAYCRFDLGSFQHEGCAPSLINFITWKLNAPVTDNAALLSQHHGLQSHDLCGSKGKKLVVIQGGVHGRYDTAKMETAELDPIFAQLDAVVASCPVPRPDLLTIVYMAADAQSRRLDGPYPVQTREKVAAFNEEIETYLRTKRPDVLVLNFWNMTRDAPTSDGFHYLTDVNVAKVYTLLRLVELEARTTKEIAPQQEKTMEVQGLFQSANAVMAERQAATQTTPIVPEQPDPASNVPWCRDRRIKYNVVVGKSWGSLPPLDRTKWAGFLCDQLGYDGQLDVHVNCFLC